MTIDVECPDCHGHGEVIGVTPSRRSRFVGYDDLSPDDYTKPCPRCLGYCVVPHDLDEDCDDE